MNCLQHQGLCFEHSQLEVEKKSQNFQQNLGRREDSQHILKNITKDLEKV
jgi:hypothetical protein